jgi:hypothetical protein
VQIDKIKKSQTMPDSFNYSVIPPRLERGTHSLEGCCSIQLSYGTIILKKNAVPIPLFVSKSGIALSNPEKLKSLISLFFVDPRFDYEVKMTSFKSGLSYGTIILKKNAVPIPLFVSKSGIALSNPEK